MKFILDEGLENIIYKPVEDIDKFKHYAAEILGGDGNMSASDIKSSIKEIYIDDKLIGYIGFSEYEEDNIKMLGIGNFMVIERGQGYGTKIINDVVETNKDKYDLIYCFVDADNAGAIKLYKKLGSVYDEDGPNDNGQYYVTFYDNGKFQLNEDLTSETSIRSAMQKIYDEYEKYNIDDGNQNCMLCTWALEMQLRGNKDFLPRPVYSPRDVIFSEINGYDIVLGPNKLVFQDKEDIVDKVKAEGPGARFYCHVNWSGSTGGHEFLLLNIENEVFIADAQANVLVGINEDREYFDDINFKNSFIVRLDDKEINEEILKYNDDDYIITWDDELDPKFLEETTKKQSKELYCISQEDLDGQTLEPRVPDNFFTQNGYEDGETPRVCFTPSVDKCLMAISQKCEGIEFYVFSPEEVPEENIYKPTTKEVPDAEITDEIWITCPVKVKKVGKIKVLGDSGLDGHPFNYGDKTTELYDWNWEWLEEDFNIEEKPDRKLLNTDKFKETNRLFLTGLPGSGKTTLGKELAENPNAELISLDLFDFERNTNNYKVGAEVPETVKQFLEIDNSENFDELLEAFIPWLCNKELDHPVIVEGYQLLNFKAELKNEAVVVLNPKLDQLVAQLMQRDSWEDTIVNDKQAESEEEFKKLLIDSCKDGLEQIAAFLESKKKFILKEDYDEGGFAIEGVETPEQLMDWMNENITYELVDDEYSNSNGVPTKTAEEVLETKTGHCAEQSYLEKEVLNELGYESFLVMVKENNSKKEYGAEGSAHVFLVYKDGDQFCWFEHSMQHSRGIHKYNSLEDLLQSVAAQWWRYDKNSDILEVRLMDKYITGVDNWGLAKECYKYPVEYTFDISDNNLESEVPEEFDPPYNADQLKKEYGEETYNKLKDDPAHQWRMETGLELIHKEPEEKELKRIWANWLLMKPEQKEESDNKSLDLFGKTNEENYSELIKEY